MISEAAQLTNETEDSENTERGNRSSLESSLLETVRDEIKEKIEKILVDVQLWSDTEKLLLYLKLPGSKYGEKNRDEQDPYAIPLSTTRAEQTQAFHWIRCHLDECENNSTLPKHEVYDEYRAYCDSVNAVRVLSAPDFGKIIKCVFPNVKARRLGTRGNSKYCYSGIQKKQIVKSPQLPNLVAPVGGNSGNSSLSLNGDKIGEEQTLIAACDLVCEWANKLLGRVFTSLIELGKFLVGGSYVSSKSMSSFVVMSGSDTRSYGILTLTGRKTNEEEDSTSLKRKHTQQHLQRKIQERQEHKQQQQQQLSLLLHPSTPTGKQFTPILPQTHKVNEVTLVNGIRIQTKPQQLQLSPKLNITGNPHTSGTPVIFNPNTQKTIGHLPPSTNHSPGTPSMKSPSLQSPYNTKSPKRNGPLTPRTGTITPSPVSTTPKYTPNGEITRFVFTPINNGIPEKKTILHGDNLSPPALKRPTATHPEASGNWSSHSKTTLRLNAPLIRGPNRYSPLQKQQNMRNLIKVRTPISSRDSRTFRHQVAMQRPSSCSVTLPAIPSNSQAAMQGISHSSQNTSLQFSNMMTSDCRFPKATTPCSPTQQIPVNQTLLDHLPSEEELEALCSQLTNNNATAVQQNRCQSVPPLTQNLQNMNTTFQPLTPQADGRHQFVAPRMANMLSANCRLINTNGNFLNTNGHVSNAGTQVALGASCANECASSPSVLSTNRNADELKQLRNRILHGDTNNNSGARDVLHVNGTAAYGSHRAKRNLMAELENPSTWTMPTSTFQQNKQQNVTYDPLAGLGFDEFAIDTSNANLDILVNDILVDSNAFPTSWGTNAPAVTLD